MISVPWFIKIPAKIILSRLPVDNITWQRWGLFRAGGMDSGEYAQSVFTKHFKATGLDNLNGCTVLELGPGNGLLTGRYAAELGAAHTWLVDSSPIAEPASFPNTTYLSNGLESLKTIPDHSVDFLFSNAVLEHVRLRDFQALAQEMYRILKPTSVSSHQIDFRDHLQFALNNLRFSEHTWESEFMARSGFYTNRLCWPKMRQILQTCGFTIQSETITRWSSLPTQQRAMAHPFREMPIDDLMINGCHAVLRPDRPLTANQVQGGKV